MIRTILVSALFLSLCRDESDTTPDYRWPAVTRADTWMFSHISKECAAYHRKLALDRLNEIRDELPFNFPAFVDADRRATIWNTLENALYFCNSRESVLQNLDCLRVMLGDDYYRGIMPASVPD